MNNYFKYLPVSKDDEAWGLTVLNAGCTHIESCKEYPSKLHPEHHNFDWNNGRVLQEYQVIYITNGQGIFESDSQKKTNVSAGTMIFLFPNERHRYRPDDHIGWDEYWIGLRGNIIENLVLAGHIKPENACINIGCHSDLLHLFNTIIENTKSELPGYQPLISGAALHLLGALHASTRQNSITLNDSHIINKAQLLFRANAKSCYSPQQAALELQVGYSWFRKRFKNYTGLSPGQYFLQLKIEEAKMQLSKTDCSIKQIAYNLHFESAFYFSKIFKEKTGLKASEYRLRSKV